MVELDSFSSLTLVQDVFLLGGGYFLLRTFLDVNRSIFSHSLVDGYIRCVDPDLYNHLCLLQSKTADMGAQGRAELMRQNTAPAEIIGGERKKRRKQRRRK